MTRTSMIARTATVIISGIHVDAIGVTAVTVAASDVFAAADVVFAA